MEIPLRDDGMDEDDESFAVDLAGDSGVTIVGAPFTVTILDDDDPPLLTAAGGSVPESGERAVVILRLSAVSGFPVAGWIGPAGGDAEAGEDYRMEPVPFLIASGQLEAEIPVTILDDAEAEGAERLVLAWRDVQHASPAEGSVFLEIIDDDEEAVDLPRLTAELRNGSEGEGPLRLVLRLSAPSAEGVSGAVHAAGGAAEAGMDYLLPEGGIRLCARGDGGRRVADDPR